MRSTLVLFLGLGACGPAPADATFAIGLENASPPGWIQPSDGSEHDVKFAPGIVIVHHPGFELFVPGSAASTDGLEALAEDGNPADLVAAMEADDQVASVGFLQHLDGVTYQAAPMLPGETAEGEFQVGNRQEVTIAFMYGESNDVLIAALGVALFDGTDALALDLGSELALYDLGTEVNQEPGLGPDQAPRQAAPDTGADESGVVTEISGTDASGFAYPTPAEMIRLSASPTAVSAEE